MIGDEELLRLNRCGLIPGPDEDEDSFLKRVATVTALPPPSAKEWAAPRILVNRLFDISPDWIPTFYSDKQLPFWQGAATWIENKIPHIQLKKAFSKGSYFKIYNRNEILAHEAAHACRMAFEEPRFEEFFAYMTSQNRFRRFFGPLFSTSKQSYVFIFSLLLSMAVQLVELFIPSHPIAHLFSFIPIPIFIIAFARLSMAHYTLKRCLKNIKSVIRNPSLSYAVVYRMTDAEIALFAYKPKMALNTALKKNSLRWRLLTLAYF